MSSMIIAVVAFLLDALIGDPRSKFHPVVLIGNLISALEKILLREQDTPEKKNRQGRISRLYRRVHMFGYRRPLGIFFAHGT